MLPASLPRAFSRFLAPADTGQRRLHFAAHSHHPWPDVSLAAHQQAWLDAATHIDAKWGGVFDTVVPAARRHVARILNLPDADTVTFAPNLHEFVLRLASCIDRTPLRILTTDGEFHSAGRQFARWEEAGQAVVRRVSVEPFDSFAARWDAAARDADVDLVYLSQVFFNSGFAIDDLAGRVRAVAQSDALIAIDGYHGFMACPTDLAPIAHRAFYLAGGYKYAMAGEGACFMHCPPGIGPRPVNTGWFAGFSGLADAQGGVSFGADASRFAGSTFDPSGLYRFNAVADWLVDADISVAAIHAHARALQQRLIDALPLAGLDADQIIPPAGLPRGNFLTFRTPQAQTLHAALRAARVLTDVRDDRLRFGFGLYQTAADVDALISRLETL